MKALAPRHASQAASHLPERTRVALAAIWRATRSVASDTLVAMQISRMASVLDRMPDTDLAKIGIARHEILGYAEQFVLDGRDGSGEPDGK